MADQTSKGSARPDSSLVPSSGKGLPGTQAAPGTGSSPLAVAPSGLPAPTHVYAAEAAPVSYASGRNWPNTDSFFSSVSTRGLLSLSHHLSLPLHPSLSLSLHLLASPTVGQARTPHDCCSGRSSRCSGWARTTSSTLLPSATTT